MFIEYYVKALYCTDIYFSKLYFMIFFKNEKKIYSHIMRVTRDEIKYLIFRKRAIDIFNFLETLLFVFGNHIFGI